MKLKKRIKLLEELAQFQEETIMDYVDLIDILRERAVIDRKLLHILACNIRLQGSVIGAQIKTWEKEQKAVLLETDYDEETDY